MSFERTLAYKWRDGPLGGWAASKCCSAIQQRAHTIVVVTAGAGGWTNDVAVLLAVLVVVVVVVTRSRVKCAAHLQFIRQRHICVRVCVFMCAPCRCSHIRGVGHIFAYSKYKEQNSTGWVGSLVRYLVGLLLPRVNNLHTCIYNTTVT